MQTERMKTMQSLEQAGKILRRGGLAAVPTETVYGLAANGLDEAAVEKIYEVKGRPGVKPLSLMVPGAGSIRRYCEDVPPAANALAKRFWPGPLTLILRAKECVPEIVRAGGETVGLRCPDHPMTLRLLELADVPFAAPSANPSGAPSPKTAQEVLAYFDGQIDAVVDGGACELGTESTILDLSQTPYRILRQGALPESALMEALRDSLTIIGITGGTGCGKTTALRAVEERGGLVIDCDAVYHDLTLNSSAMLSELNDCFPGVVCGGVLDRKALGSVVFADAGALAELSAITAKYVNKAVNAALTEWALQGGTLAAVDAIALIGSGIEPRCCATVGVTAPTQERIKRLVAREGITEEYARLRIEAQEPNEYFEANCTYTLCNDGTKEAFAEKCRALVDEILQSHREIE